MPVLALWLLALSILATLAATVMHGLGHGLIGATAAAWPAVALVGSYELMTLIRSNPGPGSGVRARERGPASDPLYVQAADTFAADVTAGSVPSIRAIRSALRVGQSRAQQIQTYLAALAEA